MGRIEGITLDWHQGVFVEASAMPPGDPRVPGVVLTVVKCCMCEWAYADAKDMRPLPSEVDVQYGYGTPDPEEGLRWAQQHRGSSQHGEARKAFIDRGGVVSV